MIAEHKSRAVGRFSQNPSPILRAAYQLFYPRTHMACAQITPPIFKKKTHNKFNTVCDAPPPECVLYRNSAEWDHHPGESARAARAGSGGGSAL